MDNKQVTQSYIYKNIDKNLVKRESEIFGPTALDVQLGNDASTTVIKGVSVLIDSNNFWIRDKIITLNKTGIAASGNSCGFEINEGLSITGYIKTNSSRDGWLLKSPASFEATLSLATLTANRAYTLPNTDGTVMLGTGIADRVALWNSTGTAVTTFDAMNNGEVIIGNTGFAPVIATLTQTLKQVLISNAAGSITFSLPQDIDSTASPTFNDLGLTGISSLLTKFGSLDIDISGLDGRLDTVEANYLTMSSAASTYLSIVNAASTYLTMSSAASTYATSTAFNTHIGLTNTAHGAISYPATADTLVARSANGSIYASNLYSIDNGLIDLTLSRGITGLHLPSLSLLYGYHVFTQTIGGGTYVGGPLYSIPWNNILHVSIRWEASLVYHIFEGDIRITNDGFGNAAFAAEFGATVPTTIVWFYTYYNNI